MHNAPLGEREEGTSMMNWNDYYDQVFLGDETYAGESLRGYQNGPNGPYVGNIEIGAGQQALAQLRQRALQQRAALGQRPGGPLAALAQSRFGRGAPLQLPVRPAFEDSTQIAIKAQVTGLTLTSWTGSTLPQFSGTTRLMESFKPEKAILQEMVTITFTDDSDVNAVRSTTVPDCGDIILTSAFVGAKNCYPNAPNEENGIPGMAFANDSYGNGISWPTVNPGIDVSLTFQVESSVIDRITPPTGYTRDDITAIAVKLRMALFGRSLRP